jgi:hypothetical protein
MSEINVKLGLDASGLQKGVQTAKSAINGLAVAATVAAVVGGAFRGMYAAMEAGDALGDMSAQTGIAVDKLMVLQMAFKQAGMAAEDVQPAVSKLQKIISEAGQGNAEAAGKFAKLGLSVNDIKNLSPDEQFAKIGDSIGKIQNPADKAAASMDFFGKKGAKLLTVFSSGGFSDAAENLGRQAALMKENAGVFGRITDVLGTAGSKIQGLFVGMAAQIMPQLTPLVEYFNKLDLTSIGESLGDGIAVAIEMLDMAIQKIKQAAEFLKPQTKTSQVYGGQAFMAMGGAGGPGKGLTEATAEAEKAAAEPAKSAFDEIRARVAEKRAAAREKYALPEVNVTDTPLTAMPATQAIGASLAQIGGGGNIFGGGIGGGDPALSIAREQLSVQEEMKRGILQLTNYLMQPMSLISQNPAVAQ